MMKIKTCPSCGSPKIKRVRRDLKRRVHDENYTARGVEFHECPDCGERVFDRDAMHKMQSASPAFAKAHA